MIHVAIAEDHFLMRESIKSHIIKNTDFSVTIEATNGYQLLEALKKIKIIPAVAVIDVHMPIMDGVAVTNFIKQNYPTIKVLALSCFDDNNTAEGMINAGATGYLLKINIDQITQILKIIHEGRCYVDSNLKNRESLYQSLLFSETFIYESQIVFTGNEKKFLQLLVADISFEKIAALMNVAKSTLDNYQKSIKEKTGINSRNAMVVFAIQYKLAKVASLPGIF